MPRTSLAAADRARLNRLARDITAAHAHAANLTQERDALLRALADGGVTYEALAGAVGLTGGRVAQICGLKSGRKPYGSAAG